MNNIDLFTCSEAIENLFLSSEEYREKINSSNYKKDDSDPDQTIYQFLELNPVLLADFLVRNSIKENIDLRYSKTGIRISVKELSSLLLN